VILGCDSKYSVTLSAAALLSFSVSAFAYDAQVANVPVGWVRVYGNSPGLKLLVGPMDRLFRVARTTRPPCGSIQVA
jgi:hypothetical protein